MAYSGVCGVCGVFMECERLSARGAADGGGGVLYTAVASLIVAHRLPRRLARYGALPAKTSGARAPTHNTHHLREPLLHRAQFRSDWRPVEPPLGLDQRK